VVRSVLVVEDEEDIRQIMEMSLATVGGLRVRMAASGAEALEALEAEIPDVILLDAMMPALDGLGTLARIRSLPACAQVPVVFCTAKAQRGEIQRFMEAGAIGVITKPFDPIALADEVRALVAAWSRGRG
jgi:CheY-like chemotaxis protein